MQKAIAFLLSLSILLPLIAGLVRYRKIPASYHPLLYLIGIGFVNELLCYAVFYNNSMIPVNFYYILEFLLFAWQFHLWKNILRSKKIFYILIGLMTVFWIIDKVVICGFTRFSPLFQVCYSLILVLLSVNQLNWLIVNDRGDIVRHPIFIICISVIIFFSYKVLTEIFYYYAPEKAIKNNIFVIQSYMNVGYNILLALAILCIPQKRTFTLPLR